MISSYKVGTSTWASLAVTLYKHPDSTQSSLKMSKYRWVNKWAEDSTQCLEMFDLPKMVPEKHKG